MKHLPVILLSIFGLFILLGAGVYYMSKNDTTIMIENPNYINPTSNNQRKKVITAFGDSITAGYNLPIEQSYPSLLEKKLIAEGYDYRVINSGSSGETSAGALSRVDWVLNTKPDIVILTIGANDAFRGVDPAETKKNISQIIEKLQAEDIDILLGGMLAPRNLGKTYTDQFDAIYPELAKQYDLELIPFFLQDVALVPELNLSDGIHPTEEGYQIIVDRNIWPKLKGMLKK
jgi:acyl-CoA thioesterase I